VNARFVSKNGRPGGGRSVAGSLERPSVSTWRRDGDDEATDAASERDFSAEVRAGSGASRDRAERRRQSGRSRVTNSATYAGPTLLRTRTTMPPTATSMRSSSPVAPGGPMRTGSNRVALRATLPRSEPLRNR